MGIVEIEMFVRKVNLIMNLTSFLTEWTCYQDDSSYSVHLLVFLYDQLWNQFRPVLCEWTEFPVSDSHKLCDICKIATEF